MVFKTRKTEDGQVLSGQSFPVRFPDALHLQAELNILYGSPPGEKGIFLKDQADALGPGRSSRSFSTTFPEVAFSSPDNIFNRVVFPQPLEPIKEINCPDSKRQERSWSTGMVSPGFFPGYVLVSSISSKDKERSLFFSSRESFFSQAAGGPHQSAARSPRSPACRPESHPAAGCPGRS